MRLATFNLLHGRSPVDGVVDPDRLMASVVPLDADVLALQEVDRGQERSGRVDQTALVATATDAVDARFLPALVGTPGEQWREAGETDAGAEPSYGVGLVSRLPVARWRRIPLGSSPARLPLLIDARRPALVRDEPRVALAAELAGPAPVGTVVATHLSFAPGVNVVQLLRLAHALRDARPPVVVLGDLNMPGPVPPAVLPGWRSLVREPTFPGDLPRIQLDHVLARGGPGAPLPEVVQGGAVAGPVSDHRALLVELGG
ncbi:endonuclease/exonuclease/phosphatase family protein [Actinomycetospora termitidis]|uniref:Endonuclease/exonuclease/phosphatase family protein n=1 Tax=Actinomycetospora termitidis TaxID=3053470 RepID=A0ABT7MGN5_9PSEU|nr:endonuclease/exonuclease/phosphatase family protein [Actinomycetospora sp. Odt1-22]MDL5158503.1 endonuclease/exonuclease/phosphatase family protein [Actinomycetospora sp. Odt1-22]